MAAPELPARLIDLLAARPRRMHHYLWHQVPLFVKALFQRLMLK